MTELHVGTRVGTWTIDRLVPADYPVRAVVTCDCGASDLLRIKGIERGAICCWSCFCRLTSRRRAEELAAARQRTPPVAQAEDVPAAPAQDAHASGEPGRAKRRRGGVCAAPIEPGARFGSWTVVREVEAVLRGERTRPSVLVRCACGSEKVAQARYLGALSSGGCRRCYRRDEESLATRRRHFIAGLGTDVRHGVGFVSSELCSTWDAAAEHLVSVCELDERQAAELKRDGYLRLRGTAYAEIMRCECATPQVHSESLAEAAE